MHCRFSCLVNSVGVWEKLLPYGRACADAVYAKVGIAPCPKNCSKFIDGKQWPICRPTRNQRNFYTAYKKMHCVKTQLIQGANGMMFNMYGVTVPRGDSMLLAESGVINTLYNLYDDNNITYFSMYGDGAYPLSELLIKGFPFDCEFNTVMSKLRITVEWGFKEIVNYFPWVDSGQPQSYDRKAHCGCNKPISLRSRLDRTRRPALRSPNGPGWSSNRSLEGRKKAGVVLAAENTMVTASQIRNQS